MTLEVEIGGRTRRITIDRAGAGFAVTVDDRPYHVDAALLDAQTVSLLVDTVHPRDGVSPDDAGRSHEAVVTRAAGLGGLIVTIGGIPVGVGMSGVARSDGRARRGSAAGDGGPERISAPMPGKIVRVMARPGDAVQVRQPLLVVEAMKMENEVRAGRDGTVTEVRAREGQSVDAGALLIVIQ